MMLSKNNTAVILLISCSILVTTDAIDLTNETEFVPRNFQPFGYGSSPFSQSPFPAPVPKFAPSRPYRNLDAVIPDKMVEEMTE